MKGTIVSVKCVHFIDNISQCDTIFMAIFDTVLYLLSATTRRAKNVAFFFLKTVISEFEVYIENPFHRKSFPFKMDVSKSLGMPRNLISTEKININ